MDARRMLAATFALAVMGHASASNADPADEGGGVPEPLPPVIVAIDFDTIPNGVIPPMPAEDAVAEPEAKESKPPALKLEKVKHPFGKMGKKRLPPELMAKIKKTELFDVTPAEPQITAMYWPATGGTEFEGESLPRVACQRKEPSSHARWETLTLRAGGEAHLSIKDLWFDSETCSLSSSPVSEVVFKAVAFDGVKPWLFAVRDDKSVTFLMPRTNEVSVDAMVGAPLTVRGGFTRVTLPVGRWGSSSLVASLTALELKAPPAPPKPPRKGQKVEAPPVEDPPSSEPVEIAVELVQTMSEKSPTLLVRRNQVAVEAPTASLTID